jgi:hypothetical protein
MLWTEAKASQLQSSKKQGVSECGTVVAVVVVGKVL